MKRKCQISLVLESISCLRKTDKQGGLSVWRIVCEAVLTCHPYVSERGDLLIKNENILLNYVSFLKKNSLILHTNHSFTFLWCFLLPIPSNLSPSPSTSHSSVKVMPPMGEVNKPGTLSWGKTETLPNASKVIKVSSHRNWRPKCQLIHQG